MAENPEDRCRALHEECRVAHRHIALAWRRGSLFHVGGVLMKARSQDGTGAPGPAWAGGSKGARGVGLKFALLALVVLLLGAWGCDKDTQSPADAGSKKPDVFITPDAETPRTVRLTFEELDLPGQTEGITNLHFIPGRSEFIVLEKNGRILHYSLDGDTVALIGTATLSGVYANSDCGLISAAFDPDFEDNNFVYFGYCDSDSYNTISRHQFDLADLNGSRAQIIRVGIDDAPRAWHNVGSIGFDPDGTMWALFGEKNVDAEAANLESNLGALLRLVPNREPEGEGYTPAPDNPFADGGGSPDIWASGLRSPWKGFRDSQGRYWVGDVGAATWEELSIISEPGQNLGWPACEGRCEEPSPELREPVTAWNRSSESDYALEDEETEATDRRVVWAGLEYQPDSADPYDGNLTGIALYGDFCAGWVRGMSVDSADRVTFDQNLGHLTGVTGVDVGPDGFVYFVTYGNCKTFPLRPGQLWRARLADPEG